MQTVSFVQWLFGNFAAMCPGHNQPLALMMYIIGQNYDNISALASSDEDSNLFYCVIHT